MDLSTSYLGLKLANPIVVGACPLGTNADTIRHLEEAGAAAIVLPSLFEEEIRAAIETQLELESTGAGFAEATGGYHPDPEGYHVGPAQYLEHLEAVKASTSIPVIGSLNGTTPGGWTRYAKKIQDAGADALELNVFYLPMEADEPGEAVEQRVVEVVRTVKQDLSIPIAVKLSPFFSSIPNLARKLQQAGADGLVVFNRFYQPDIDIEQLDVVPNLRLSTADELRLRLRWLAILSSQTDMSLAATGGAHNAVDVIKAVMAGAHAVQLVSALLIHGAEHIGRILEAMEFWMGEHDYQSLSQMHGSMNLSRTPNPNAFARANYMRMLDSWQM
jgi:dihydroorotate dehydrogenase (fumarate)